MPARRLPNRRTDSCHRLIRPCHSSISPFAFPLMTDFYTCTGRESESHVRYVAKPTSSCGPGTRLFIKIQLRDAYRRDHGLDRGENGSSAEVAAHYTSKQTTLTTRQHSTNTTSKKTTLLTNHSSSKVAQGLRPETQSNQKLTRKRVPHTTTLRPPKKAV